MAKKSSNESYEDKLRKVKLSDGLYSRKNLPIPDHEETIAELLKEGERLLAEEEKLRQRNVVTETRRLETKLGSTSSNPYIRARCDIMSKWATDKLKLFEEMENSTRPKDHRYDDFVREVAKLGDKLSEGK